MLFTGRRETKRLCGEPARMLCMGAGAALLAASAGTLAACSTEPVIGEGAGSIALTNSMGKDLKNITVKESKGGSYVDALAQEDVLENGQQARLSFDAAPKTRYDVKLLMTDSLVYELHGLDLSAISTLALDINAADDVAYASYTTASGEQVSTLAHEQSYLHVKAKLKVEHAKLGIGGKSFSKDASCKVERSEELSFTAVPAAGYELGKVTASNSEGKVKLAKDGKRYTLAAEDAGDGLAITVTAKKKAAEPAKQPSSSASAASTSTEPYGSSYSSSSSSRSHSPGSSSHPSSSSSGKSSSKKSTAKKTTKPKADSHKSTGTHKVPSSGGDSSSSGSQDDCTHGDLS